MLSMDSINLIEEKLDKQSFNLIEEKLDKQSLKMMAEIWLKVADGIADGETISIKEILRGIANFMDAEGNLLVDDGITDVIKKIDNLHLPCQISFSDDSTNTE